MHYFIIAAAILAAAAAIFIITGYIKKVRLRRMFRGTYFDLDNEDYDFESLRLIRRYWDTKNRLEKPAHIIDDTTWNDLDMDLLFLAMNSNRSSAGEEYLYAKLREVSFDKRELSAFGGAVDFMDNAPDTKTEALCALHALGRDAFNNVHSYIYQIDEQPLKNIKKYYILMAMPIIGIMTCFFTPAGAFFVLAALTVNIFTYYKNKFRIAINLNSLAYISKLAHCARKLSKLDYGKLDYSDQLKTALKPLRRLGGLGNALVGRAATDLEFLLEYVKIALMWDFINYNRMIRILSKNREPFHQLYKLVGEIDCSIAVGAYRSRLDFYTVPAFHEDDNIIIEEVYHPLVKNPVLNSIDWKNNAIITGSNASGKSTFVKALALSMICAQSVYLCFAKRFASKMSVVMTSMAVRDKVYDGESYFVAEVKSLKRIFDALDSQTRTVCFIDEILKGTNTIERISASASILNWLARCNCFAMTASHDIELTEVLGRVYDNYHFCEQVQDNSIVFDYKLRKGFAKTRNAIKLLGFMGYSGEIIDMADKLAGRFEENRKWDIL